MARNLRVVHESETQRQHVRVTIPASARIGNKLYKVKDLSVGGICVYTEEKFTDTSPVMVKILFPFDSYAFHLEIKAQCVNDDREKKTASFKFTEINSSQACMINYVLKSFLSGTMITAGDLINIVSRDNFIQPRTTTVRQEKNLRSLLRKVIPTLMIVSLGAAGALFFAGNIYERSSILKSYNGIIDSPKIEIRSPAEGTVNILVPEETEKVAKGQPLLTIEKIGGGPASPETSAATPGVITLNSPCDCHIQVRHAQSGEFTVFGGHLFTLVPIDSRLWVTTLIAPEKAHHLRLQGDANIRIAGEGGFVPGNIMDIGSDNPEKPYTRVQIKPETPMSLEMLGRPAYVEFARY